MTGKSISRRAFLHGSAAVGTVAGLGTASPAHAAAGFVGTQQPAAGAGVAGEPSTRRVRRFSC